MSVSVLKIKSLGVIAKNWLSLMLLLPSSFGRTNFQFIFVAIAILLFPFSCFAQRESAPIVGEWEYGSSSCNDYTHWGYQDPTSSTLAAIERAYNMCGDGAIQSEGNWGTPQLQTGGACGSTNYYPTFKWGIENEVVNLSGQYFRSFR